MEKIMVVDFICLQFIDFTNDAGNHIKGTRAWYLDPPDNSQFVKGTVPRNKWFPNDDAQSLGLTDVGKYDILTNLSGKIISLKKL